MTSLHTKAATIISDNVFFQKAIVYFLEIFFTCCLGLIVFIATSILSDIKDIKRNMVVLSENQKVIMNDVVDLKRFRDFSGTEKDPMHKDIVSLLDRMKGMESKLGLLEQRCLSVDIQQKELTVEVKHIKEKMRQ